MYITVKTLKRNLGFKGIELNDILIAFPMLTIFLILFSLTKYKLLSIVLVMICGFLLLPINVSKKNRMYKVLLLVIKYIFSTKLFVYSKQILEKERMINVEKIKNKFGF